MNNPSNIKNDKDTINLFILTTLCGFFTSIVIWTVFSVIELNKMSFGMNILALLISLLFAIGVSSVGYYLTKNVISPSHLSPYKIGFLTAFISSYTVALFIFYNNSSQIIPISAYIMCLFIVSMLIVVKIKQEDNII